MATAIKTNAANALVCLEEARFVYAWQNLAFASYLVAQKHPKELKDTAAEDIGPFYAGKVVNLKEDRPGSFASSVLGSVDLMLAQIVERCVELLEKSPKTPVVEKAISLSQWASFDGAHHKAWAIDQMVRALAGDNYGNWSKTNWDEGIAP